VVLARVFALVEDKWSPVILARVFALVEDK